MTILGLSAMYFAPGYLRDSVKLAALAYDALRGSKWLFGVPRFRYCAVADGIRRILEGSTRPSTVIHAPAARQTQLPLFNP
jgi:hypothetical protein